MRIGKTIYLDHQATTPVDARVLAEMTPYFTDSFGNPHSSDHSLGWESAQAVENAAARLARLIGADADEVFRQAGLLDDADGLTDQTYAARAVPIDGRRADRRGCVARDQHNVNVVPSSGCHLIWCQGGESVVHTV